MTSARTTIYALSSASGRAGVAVLRISGPATLPALTAISGINDPKPRYAHFCHFRAPESGTAIDSGLAIYFPAPASFTGEDVAELHCHGGRAVVKSLLAALGSLPGLRHAEPGEFSRRAFVNGKLDLLQAEAISDLIEADTEAQRQQAQKQASGATGATYRRWRDMLIEARALIEACIDFPDEDIPANVLTDANTAISTITREIEQALTQKPVGERIHDGIKIAIIGAPNVGKSTLLNYLAERDAAIVSEIAGTTRDVIEVTMDIDGYPVTIYDTAGIRETNDPIEREGVARARNIAAMADLIIHLHDASAPPPAMAENEWHVFNMVDKLSISPTERGWNYGTVIGISLKHSSGLSDFMAELRRRIHLLVDSSEPAIITRSRHRQALAAATPLLYSSLENKELELRAEELRLATEYLASVTGNINSDELLGEIFGRFCIGK